MFDGVVGSVSDRRLVAPCFTAFLKRFSSNCWRRVSSASIVAVVSTTNSAPAVSTLREQLSATHASSTVSRSSGSSPLRASVSRCRQEP
ncbi:hypothetical protein BRC63_01670 [Halobacteriales archaeon QH_10_70_21]|nr:MAG: hypothetical protein BRC63_01670 [Halobacteriales archaeon QH_10_70_21]